MNCDMHWLSIDPDDITNEEVLTSFCVGLIVIDEMRIVRLVRKYSIIEMCSMLTPHRLYNIALFRTHTRASTISRRSGQDFSHMLDISLCLREETMSR
jgi:hypothetical protein